MSTIKYLYGKSEFLSGLIEGGGTLRLCDIRHYGRLENEKIRDLEERKEYEYEPGAITLSINDHEIQAEEFASNLKLNLPTRLCYCICFSSKKDAPELYNKFDADVCLEFNVDSLTEFLEFVFPKDHGCQVEHRPVTYYDVNPLLNMTDPHNSVFMKHLSFKDEDEYRLAVFFPFDGRTILNAGGQKIEMLKQCLCKPEEINRCTCYFIYLDNGLSDKFASYISNVYTRS